MSTEYAEALESAFDETWHTELCRLELARQAYHAALDGPPARRRETAREYWGMVGIVLRLYAAGRNWPDGKPLDSATMSKRPRLALPPKLAETLANAALYAHVGQVPESMLHTRGKGRLAAGPDEALDKTVAVAMAAAVRQGLIKGTLAEVATKCGMGRRALEQLCADKSWVDAELFGSPEALTARFSKASERLRAMGRSAEAIVKRSSKRRKQSS